MTAESYGSSIAPSASVAIGFTGNYTTNDVAPASFTVNVTACTT